MFNCHLGINSIPNVGAVYDRPQFGGLPASQLWAVIDRPYIGESRRAASCNPDRWVDQSYSLKVHWPFE
jgi:hypothetical protein